MTINRFRGKYGFLSNFYTLENYIDLYGYEFPTVEHAFAACKVCPGDENRNYFLDKISKAETPMHAKSMGRSVPLRDNWEGVKIQMMHELLRLKFTNNEDLAQKLLATGNKELVEGNYHRDVFWGYCLNTNTGRNVLGVLLTNVRKTLRDREKLCQQQSKK